VIHRCRACAAAELTGHPGFAAAVAGRDPLPDPVYLWSDRTVTELPLPGTPPLFAADDAAWRELCDGLTAAPAAR
jgi:hypothetical protein